MTDNQDKLLSEEPNSIAEPSHEGSSAPAGNTDQPTTEPVASSPPPAYGYGRLDEAPNQQNVPSEMQGAPMPITAYPDPPRQQPHTYLALTVVTVVICSVLNPLSMGLGIPAVVLSGLSFTAIQNNQWKSAEKYGKIAFYLTVINWIYVLFAALVTFATCFGIIASIRD